MVDLSLTQLLAWVGWSHGPPLTQRLADIGAGRAVYNQTGRLVGHYSAYDCWRLLQAKGLIAEVLVMPPRAFREGPQ